MDNEAFVQNVKARCKSMGVSVSQACRESGAGRSLIDNVLKGSSPSIDKIERLADYLGCTTSDLLGEKRDLEAAFWGGDKDLSPEDMDAMWADVKKFAAFIAEKRKQEKQNND